MSVSVEKAESVESNDCLRGARKLRVYVRFCSILTAPAGFSSGFVDLKGGGVEVDWSSLTVLLL